MPRADRGPLGVTLGARNPAFGMTLDTVFGTVLGTFVQSSDMIAPFFSTTSFFLER